VRKQWRSLLGAVVGVGFLAWALHGISFDEVWLHIRHANPGISLARAWPAR
jgi:hypothetical protein